MEATKKDLELPELEPQVANLFVQRLYSDTGVLPITSHGGRNLPIIEKNSLPAYIHLYMFADSRCIESLKAEALRQIVHFYSRMQFFVLEPTLCLVYEITPPKCRLRVFMSRAWNFYQSRGQGNSTTRQAVELVKKDAEFGEDLVLAMTDWPACKRVNPVDRF